jgi:hypothetical protein
MLREVYEMLVGFALVFTAFILSFMMVVGVLEKDILLSLLAYSMSLAGIVVGCTASWDTSGGGVPER